MNTDLNNKINEIPAFKVNQWLDSWNDVNYNSEFKDRPLPYFYLFSMPAVQLKKLSGIVRRTTDEGIPRAEDIGIQRRHNPERSKSIREYVKYGSPYSELNNSQKISGRFNELKMPGWLPTAIVVNIIKPNEYRIKSKLHEYDSITIEEINKSIVIIKLPNSFTWPEWRPMGLHPIEVIDGQHRLWAFENENQLEYDNFELPVVAFHGLDRSWQAYIFWMINIKPKRINKSLAFDLYPLLRTENWLVADEGISVYRETRAQELTESLWSNQHSPWYHRIDMLGDSGQKGMLTQAGWIRSLLETFIKNLRGKKKEIGGLYGTNIDKHEVLSWDRVQQAAFIIFIGQKLKENISLSNDPWAQEIRLITSEQILDSDPAFISKFSLLNTDIGNRAFLGITNDLFFVSISDTELSSWMNYENDENETESLSSEPTDELSVGRAIDSLTEYSKITSFINELTSKLAKYDWRTAATPNLNLQQKLIKSSFRGGPGYKSMRKDLLMHLIHQSGPVGDAAKKVNLITEELVFSEEI